ncbi:hypothetical protein BH11ACT8_BH11ACT8_19860 [soil metagenome]
MRRYDDPVEVRRGSVGGSLFEGEAPEQFLWRGRLWKVRAVLARWVETGAWWQSSEVSAVLGTDGGASGGASGGAGGGAGVTAVPTLVAPVDLLGEREMWRVEAGRGGPGVDTGGVFDLSFDWSDGRWSLVGCAD